MKPPAIALNDIRELEPIYQLVIPTDYLDENGHMNMRWYLAVFDDAGYPFVAQFGLTLDYHERNRTGGFDLEHHIHYLNEVRAGDTVTIYARLVQRTAKRIHYLMFMVNEARNSLAAIFECVNSFADMSARRTAPYPAEIAERIDALLAQHTTLTWAAPTSGIMRA